MVDVWKNLLAFLLLMRYTEIPRDA